MTQFIKYRKMKNTETGFGFIELSSDESVDINGGDNFLHDLGYAIRRFVRAFVDQEPDRVAVRTWTYLHYLIANVFADKAEAWMICKKAAFTGCLFATINVNSIKFVDFEDLL